MPKVSSGRMKGPASSFLTKEKFCLNFHRIVKKRDIPAMSSREICGQHSDNDQKSKYNGDGNQGIYAALSGFC